MKPEELFEYYTNMDDNRVLVSFKGPISKDILVEMGSFVKKQLASDHEVKRVFSVFVEMTQNVLRHSDERDVANGNTGVGVVLLSEQKDEYTISSGNLVNRDNCEKLSKHCEQINELDEAGLKDAYKKQRKAERIDDSQGAGLGIIDIRRKSNNRIQCKVMPFSEEKDFLVLTAKVNKGKTYDE